MPFVSVIVCAKNAESSIAACLQSILNQNYDNYEIIIMNDYSVDNTEKIITEFQKDNSHLHLSIPTQNIVGKKLAITEGVNMANGEWIFMIDADCATGSNQWIRTMMNAVDDKDDLILGYGGYEKENTLLNKLIRYETYYIALQYFTAALLNSAYMGVGRNLAFRKEAFLENSPFSDNFSVPFGDDDSIVRGLATGNNIAVCLSPQSYTLSNPNKDFHSYWQQKKRHLRPSLTYRMKDKLALGLLGLSHIVFFLAAILTLGFGNYLLAIGMLVMRWFIMAFFSKKLLKVIKEKDLIIWMPISDAILAFIYLMHIFLFPFEKRNW